MDEDALSFKIKRTDCAKSGVACHLAFYESLDLVFLLLGVLNAVKHEFGLLESFGVAANLFDDLERVLLVLFVVALVIQLVITECNVAEAVSHKGVLLSKQVSMAVSCF